MQLVRKGHLPHKSGDFVPIQLFVQNQWQAFDAQIYFHTNRKVDVTIINLSQKISQRIEFPEEFRKRSKQPDTMTQQTGISLDSILVSLGPVASNFCASF